MPSLDLVTVRVGDAAYFVPRHIAELVARLRAAGDRHGALALARDNHAGAPNTVPPGGQVNVPLMLADHLPEPMRKAAREMSTNSPATLQDAQAEIARLREHVAGLQGVNAALVAAHPSAAAPGRATFNDAAQAALREDAYAATLREQAMRDAAPGRAAFLARLRDGWKGDGAR